MSLDSTELKIEDTELGHKILAARDNTVHLTPSNLHIPFSPHQTSYHPSLVRYVNREQMARATDLIHHDAPSSSSIWYRLPTLVPDTNMASGAIRCLSGSMPISILPHCVIVW